MPYTLAHPAAVLPLRSATRRHLALAPLAIGATMPDVQYFTRLAAEGRFTHTLPGLLLVCLPVGWIVLLLFDRFGRAGVAALLPAQWRLPDAPESRPLLLTSLALFIGSVTHVVWDAFTHDYGWVVRTPAGPEGAGRRRACRVFPGIQRFNTRARSWVCSRSLPPCGRGSATSHRWPCHSSLSGRARFLLSSPPPRC